MRLIGTLQDEAQARRFGGFLYSQGIEAQIDPGSNDNWEIWVLDDDHLETATGLWEAFCNNPGDPRYAQGAQVAVRRRRQDRKKETPKRFRQVDGRTTFAAVTMGLGRVTMVLMAICIAVAIFSNLGKDDRILRPLVIADYGQEGYYDPPFAHLPEVRRGQIWRLVTPIFIHFGIMHILFNMLWLRDLGSMIEGRRGSGLFVALVLVLAVTSNVGQYLVSGPTFGGMSGVVYGLLGYAWMQGKFNPRSQLALHPQTVTMMLIWFVLCLSGAIGHIANTAHAVGLGVGVAWGYLAAQWPRWRR